MTTEKRNDEIDLIEVFLNIYIFIKKHFWVLFISGIIGGALGYSTKFIGKKHYESSMLIESYTLSDNILVEYINNIQTIINDDNYEYLGSQTNLSVELISNLEHIETEKTYNEKEKKYLKYLKINCSSISNSIYKNLSNGLINYLNKMPYVQNELEHFVDQNNALIEKIDQEILLLEKLQNNISENRSKSGVNIYNEQNSFHQDLLGLLREKQRRQKELLYATPFRVIEDFIIYQKPVRKTVTYTFIGAFTLSFLILLILIFKQINKNISNS